MILLFSTESYSQLSRKEEIAKGDGSTLYVLHTTFKDGNTKDLFVLMGRNREYTELVDFIDVFSGTANEMSNFLTETQYFAEQYKNDQDVSQIIYGNSVSIMSVWGFKGIRIYNHDKNGTLNFSFGNFNKFVKKFYEYCKKKNIELEYSGQ